MARRDRYREMERFMTKALLADLVLFLLYLLFAGIGVAWLKIILSICVVLISSAGLAFLYMTRELLRPRSLWITTAAASILVCLIFSLILNYP